MANTDQYVGIDRDLSRRPGVPMEYEPRPAPGAHFPISRQRSNVKVFQHGRPGKTFPPVFGTAQPPRALSGLVRAFAYRYPDHMPIHWMSLMLADRVNVLETRLPKLFGIGALGFVGLRLVRRFFA